MNGILVVDASAVVEVLRRSDRGARVADAMRGMALTAPAHLDAEVLSALGRLARADAVDDAVVRASLGALRRMPLQRYPVTPLLESTWKMRHNISLRDGLYVACCQILDATLLTLDARLSRSAPVGVVLVD